ncbi:MAG: diadenosine tetraphosphate hydrolase [Candidatus Aenigmarchaeota archaeon ex4484_52]|nr:MAG: diadenosine tetraphosphate hydrolase [Candidatus Aenigmarchaeota archaeon ex4484_52]
MLNQKLEKSVGAVVFYQSKKDKEVYYLLLQHQNAFHWSMPKGRIERKETEKQTAIREIKEETDIDDLIFYDTFREEIKYKFKHNNYLINKTVVFFLCKTNMFDIKLSNEHINFKWLKIKDAIKLATHKNTKDVLKKADEFITRRGLNKINA